MLLQPQDFEQSLFLFDSGNWLILLDSLLGSGNTHSRSFFLVFHRGQSWRHYPDPFDPKRVCGKRALGQVINAVIIAPGQSSLSASKGARGFGACVNASKWFFCFTISNQLEPSNVGRTTACCSSTHLSCLFSSSPSAAARHFFFRRIRLFDNSPPPPPFAPREVKAALRRWWYFWKCTWHDTLCVQVPPSLLHPPRKSPPLPHHPHASPCRSI